MRPPFLKAVSAFWAEDRGLSTLLILLIVAVFILPPLTHVGTVGRLTLSVFFTLILFAGVAAVSRSPTALVSAGTVGAAAVISRWLSHALALKSLATLDALLFVVATGLLAVMVLSQVFRAGPITLHRILGAVAVYLLLGLMWAAAYQLIALQRPAAFRFPEGVTWDQPGILLYFSFTTLTTAGYGDITAVDPAARSAAMLEALVGQLFPAILIARLVSMELLSRPTR